MRRFSSNLSRRITLTAASVPGNEEDRADVIYDEEEEREDIVDKDANADKADREEDTRLHPELPRPPPAATL